MVIWNAKHAPAKRSGDSVKTVRNVYVSTQRKFGGPGGPTPEKPTDDRDWLCKKCRGNRLKKLNIKPHI